MSKWYEASRPTATDVTPYAQATPIMAGTLRATSAADAGGAISRPNTSSVPTVRNEATTAMVTSESMAMCTNLGMHAQHAGLLFVERQRQEPPVQGSGRGRCDHQRARQHRDVAGGDTERVAEQDPGERPGVAPTAGDDHDTEREHADEQQADAGVLVETGVPVHEIDPRHHGERRCDRSEGEVEPEQDSESDAGEDSVGQRITHETQPADHHPGADQGGDEGGERTCEKRALNEPER